MNASKPINEWLAILIARSPGDLNQSKFSTAWPNLTKTCFSFDSSQHLDIVQFFYVFKYHHLTDSWQSTLTSTYQHCVLLSGSYCYPDSKVHGANLGPNWVLSAPDGPHIGPMNLAIRVVVRDTPKLILAFLNHWIEFYPFLKLLDRVLGSPVIWDVRLKRILNSISRSLVCP